MTVDNSTDSLAVVEQLVEQTIKEVGEPVAEKAAATPETDNAPISLIKKEETSADQPAAETKPAAEQKPVIDYRKQAMEQMKKDLADKPNLTDADIETAMYQRVINAAKRVQREVEQRKSLESQLGELNKFKAYVEQLYQVPQFVALTQGKGRIVLNDEQPAGQEGEIMDDPIQKLAQRLEEKIASVEARIVNRDQKEQALTQKQQIAEQEKKLTSELDKEERVLCARYPLFKEWVDYRKRSGICPPELEEVVNLAEQRGYSLTDAAKIYFTDKGVSALLESNKQETLQNLKNKAAQRTEGGRAEIPAEEAMNFSDTRSLAERLVENALK